ncbi:MAG TPA: AI-2E family transporter [Nocardioides sp.]|nr:AI-2E family transporter [Nocardioides sp.]
MNQSRTLSLLVGAAAIVILVAGLRATAGIVGPVVLALALTILFHPVRVRLERRMPSWAASILVLLSAYLLIVVFAFALVVSVGRLATLIADYDTQAADMTANIHDSLADLGVGSDQAEGVAGALDVTRLLDLATSVLSGILSALSGLLFIGTLLLFMAFDSAKAGRLAEGVRAHRPHLVEGLGSFAHGTRNYLGVSAVFGLIVAVIDTAVLYAIGIPGALIWGVLAFVTNFIPNIGFVIGVIPPALIGLLEGGADLMIAVIVLYSVINAVIQSIIQPRFVGDAVGLSTTLTFLSLVFWTWVLGPLGALLAVPMTLFFRAILVEADPAADWMRPLISGDPVDEPVAEGS